MNAVSHLQSCDYTVDRGLPLLHEHLSGAHAQCRDNQREATAQYLALADMTVARCRMTATALAHMGWLTSACSRLNDGVKQLSECVHVGELSG